MQPQGGYDKTLEEKQKQHQEFVVALHDYVAKNSDELSFKAGTKIALRPGLQDHWSGRHEPPSPTTPPSARWLPR